MKFTFHMQIQEQYLRHRWEPSFSFYLKMKLDTRAIRYLSNEDWRVLAAVSRKILKPCLHATDTC